MSLSPRIYERLQRFTYDHDALELFHTLHVRGWGERRELDDLVREFKSDGRWEDLKTLIIDRYEAALKQGGG